ncbi:MAG: chromosome segregation protein SMC [Lachnospiraceae bacterium]|nr:chromosome segregation protein SMC [Lachnospiraceae bacterium]
MFLKSIEVQGFKSFANKLNFEFHNGVTCIVGPNGSGKSNVADAVRWVLGEQSAKQLRGANMQDVIFSGTELRKPQGYAYVSITLDNADRQLPIDYEEVTVSRRVYRSGESEYKINGVISRLRDIQELFYDTGIGKEGYSIIGQGQIDKILSNKPDERRELFDEAVGIVKFKRRKKETLKKLESEHANLVRVTDILYELEKQVGPLGRQAENAKKYLNLRDELKKVDRQLFTLDYDASNRELEENQKNTEIVTGHLQDVDAEQVQLETQYQEVNTKVREYDTSIEEGNARFNELSVSLQDKEGRIAVLREQINTENTNEQHLNERLSASNEEENKYLQEQKNLQNDKVANAERERTLANEEYGATNTLAALDIRIARHQKSVEESKNKLINLMNEKTGETSKLSHYETLEQQLLLRRGEISSRIIKLKSEKEDLDTEQDSLKSNQKELAETVSVRRKNYTSVVNDRRDAQTKYQSLLNDAQKYEQEYKISSSRAEQLRNLEERYEGFGNSVKRVMDYAGKNGRGIEGVVSNLIKVDKKYETAIEIALGGAIQNIVTISTDVAKKMIAYLKENKFGRATFLPLDAYKDATVFAQKEALKSKGVIGIANTLVTNDKKYDNLISHLLGRTLVVDNIDNATAIAKANRYQIRIVTLEGDLLSPGGSLTGGTFKNTSNLLGRKNEIEELEKTAASASKNLKETVAARDKIKNKLDSLEAQEKEVSDDLQKLLLDKTAIDMRLSAVSDKLDKVMVELADATGESASLEGELGKLRSQKEQVYSSLANIENENSDYDKNISEDERKLQEEKNSREELNASLTSVRIELSKLKQKKDFAVENEQRVADELERIRAEKRTLTERLGKTGASIDSINAQINDLNAERDKEMIEKDEVALRVKQATFDKSQIMADQTEFFAKQKDISERKKDLEVELLRLQNRHEKLEEHLEERVNYFWIEYEMSPTEAVVPEEEITASATELKKTVTSLKGSIKALGSVNVNAIEEYKEVSERYEFMKTQYEDLTKAEKTLHGIIDELDEGMRRQFNEQFARIQVEFDKVFAELFGGGHGKLELVEDEDVIEAGIRIISQPPGKKLQNMMQLSGGEKALTAIALLFAIQNLKPSPFCLLDEIEAALDDSNVSRFAGYLHKLTEHTQFILISHRRGTMIMADRLYGITMQEKGVSTLVSVNLIESELDN